jgi:hypothetical protein
VSYDHAIVSLHLPEHPVAVDAPDDRRRSLRDVLGGRMDGGRNRLVPASPWLTALAFTVVALPFVVALGILITQSGSHLTLADDLALIDLHTRRALTWKQQLGVFDHYGWNHPGPSYFYLLSVVYRVLGSGAKSMFIGSTLINGLCAVACVAVVRHRSTPGRALWASVWICGLVALFAASGHVATTYSESLLGGLVSPWNPMVVTFPLLLTVLLCAASFDRSGLSLLAAVGTGSFVVQTDVSALPVVAVVGGLAFLAWSVTSIVDLAGLGVGKRASSRRRAWLDHRHWVVGPILALGSVALIVLMWVPPYIQQRSNHPGNLTLIARFFKKQHGTYPLAVGWKSLLSVDSVVMRGPSEIMRSDLGLVVHQPGIAWTATVLAGAAALVAIVFGVIQRNRFAIGVGALSLAGGAAVVVSSTRVVGFIFGYLLIWAVVLPVAALIGPGLLSVPGRPRRHAAGAGRPVTASSALRVALCGVAVAVCVVAVVRVTDLPPLTAASDPTVGRLAALVTPSLKPGSRVFVGDDGAGTTDTRLLDTEEFIGLVNLLDQGGYRPTVNHIWRTEFGPGYQTDGRESRQINLTTWNSGSPSMTGYVGKAGNMAVTVTDHSGAAIAHGT